MLRLSRASQAALVILGLALGAAPAAAQFGGGLRGTAVGLTYDVPTGDFAKRVGGGIGVALRTGSYEGYETWTGRTSFGFDRFPGKDDLDNVQFIGGGVDFVHHSQPSWYQFGGFTLSQVNYTYKAGTTQTNAVRNGSNFGLTAGFGFNFGEPTGTQTFVEVGAATVFTGASNSAWFPVRFGIRF